MLVIGWIFIALLSGVLLLVVREAIDDVIRIEKPRRYYSTEMMLLIFCVIAAVISPVAFFLSTRGL